MKDRLVEHANRYRLTPVKGADNIYDIEPTPGEVTEEGTLINKSTLLKDSTAALYGLPKTLGDAEVGEILKLNVGGVPTEFIVVQQGLPSSMYDESCNGTWLLMKDGYTARQWHSSNVNDYANSDINKWLNNDFIALLDSDIQDAVKTVKIPYRPGSGMGATVNSGATGLSVKAFLLSWLEIGFNSLNSPIDGVRLDYFDLGDSAGASNRTKRIANYNGTPVIWCTRSPYCAQATYLVWGASSVGSETNFVASNPSVYVRPALVLPSTLHITLDRDVTISTDPVPDDVFSKIHDMLGGYKIRRTLDGYNLLYSLSRIQGSAIALNDGSTAATYYNGSSNYQYRIYNNDGTTAWSATQSSNAPILATASEKGSTHKVVSFGQYIYCDGSAWTHSSNVSFPFATDNYYGGIYCPNGATHYAEYYSYSGGSKISVNLNHGLANTPLPLPLAAIGDKVIYILSANPGDYVWLVYIGVLDCSTNTFTRYYYNVYFPQTLGYNYAYPMFIDGSKAYIHVYTTSINGSSSYINYHKTPLIINLEDMSSNVSDLNSSDLSGQTHISNYYLPWLELWIHYIGSIGSKHYFSHFNNNINNGYRIITYDDSTNTWGRLPDLTDTAGQSFIRSAALSNSTQLFTPHRVEWKIPGYEDTIFLNGFMYDMQKNIASEHSVYTWYQINTYQTAYIKATKQNPYNSNAFSAYQFCQQNKIITEIPYLVGTAKPEDYAWWVFGGKSLHYDVEITPQ